MSKSFIRLSWITLVFIFLVVIAGSIVRSSGAGMGCPDWPKCFNQIIPPTDVNQLPENYQEIYLEKRLKKIDRFVSVLQKIGLGDIGKQIKNDESLHREETFNWVKTWTEYGNRLVGFIAGNLVLITFIWVIIKYRRNRKLVTLSFLNLILISFEGWLGSIVVATNLLPWVLTLHMLFALIIIWIQIEIIRIAQNKTYQITISKTFKYLFYLSILLTILQILMGVQVRQKIDFLVEDNVHRAEWIHNLDIDFYFHRSFSWFVLLINVILFWYNRNKHYGIPIFNFIILLISVEFLTGVLFSYANMPAVTQPFHILAACLMLGFQLYGLNYLKYRRESLLR